MKHAKMEKGHYIANGNIQAFNSNKMLAFGDEFDVVHIHKNNRVDVLFEEKNYTFDIKRLSQISIPLSH